MSALKKHALALASAGIPIFPCVKDGKAPATANGFKDSTTDLLQIEQWWTEEPEYNIGVVPDEAGWLVVDLDPGSDAGWINLVRENGGHEATYEVTTPRGGRHLYFAGHAVSSVQKLAGHVDTRGVGGYVLVPPSAVGGREYFVSQDRDVAPLPAWISEALGRQRVHVKADSDIELDLLSGCSKLVRNPSEILIYPATMPNPVHRSSQHHPDLGAQDAGRCFAVSVPNIQAGHGRGLAP